MLGHLQSGDLPQDTRERKRKLSFSMVMHWDRSKGYLDFGELIGFSPDCHLCNPSYYIIRKLIYTNFQASATKKREVMRDYTPNLLEFGIESPYICLRLFSIKKSGWQFSDIHDVHTIFSPTHCIAIGQCH